MESKSKRSGVVGRRGFTLIELILVVAVVAILAAILVPTVFSILDESSVTKGQADVKAVAGSIVKFRKDLGEFPTRQSDADAEVNMLYSGTTAPSATDFSATGVTAFDCDTSGECESFLFPFFTNSTSGVGVAYSAVGKKQWKGPYLSENTADDFGTPYITYVRRLQRAGGFTSERAWVVFAGENKVYETTPGHTSAQGDDIVFLIK